MNFTNGLGNIIARNLIGLLALLAVHYASDQYSIQYRNGFEQTSPYLFLFLLYGWIVFHNRILFERYFLNGKKGTYAAWTALCLTLGTLNMYFILHTVFGVEHALPHILSFFLYTITGLGIFVIFRYVQFMQMGAAAKGWPSPRQPESSQTSSFSCTVDGRKVDIPFSAILYVESLENYVKVVTDQKTYLVRNTVKETEELLPKPYFLRISRSHIINTSQIAANEGNTIRIGNESLRIGKVYKRYVEDQLKS